MQAVLISFSAEESAVLATILQQAGLVVRTLRDFNRALEDWPDRPADLLLVATFSENPISQQQIKQLRAHTAAPILIIDDPLSENQLVNLMEAGADLVVCRPYGVRLLLAQVRGLLRRGVGLPFSSLPTLTQAGVTIDPSARTVQVGDEQPKHLTQLEFRLLYTFITHPGQILSAESLVEHVWGYSGEGNRDLVRGLVQRLRTKVEPTPRQPRYILTEAGAGYYFNKNPQGG